VAAQAGEVEAGLQPLPAAPVVLTVPADAVPLPPVSPPVMATPSDDGPRGELDALRDGAAELLANARAFRQPPKSWSQ